jgi:hypothetical protein
LRQGSTSDPFLALDVPGYPIWHQHQYQDDENNGDQFAEPKDEYAEIDEQRLSLGLKVHYGEYNPLLEQGN